MKRWLPAPLLSLALFALWLLLNQSASPGHLLVAAVVGLIVPVLSAPLRPQRALIARPLAALRLVFVVGFDVLWSCMQVARGVLRSGGRPPESSFVRVPLELRDPHALGALAIITAVVPGTVWTELAPDRSSLLLHVFEVGQEADFIRRYKQRYERPLLEIFQ